MLNKNDPLIGAVQEVMKRNQAERDAAKLVNEKFGIHDRKALPHEKQGEWDAAYKTVLNEALHPNQEKLDLNKNKKLDKQDFKMLRAKKPMEEATDGDTTSPSSMGIKKPDYATGTPDYAKPKEQTVNRAAKTSLPAGTMKEEEQIDEANSKEQLKAKYDKHHDQVSSELENQALGRGKTMSASKLKRKADAAGTAEWMLNKDGRKKHRYSKNHAKKFFTGKKVNEEEQLDEKAPPGAKYERMVKHIKDKMAKGGLTKKEKSIAYATAWKAKKKSDVNEGFNDRHSLSVTASAEKQTVAEQSYDNEVYDPQKETQNKFAKLAGATKSRDIRNKVKAQILKTKAEKKNPNLNKMKIEPRYSRTGLGWNADRIADRAETIARSATGDIGDTLRLTDPKRGEAIKKFNPSDDEMGKLIGVGTMLAPGRAPAAAISTAAKVKQGASIVPKIAKAEGQGARIAGRRPGINAGPWGAPSTAAAKAATTAAEKAKVRVSAIRRKVPGAEPKVAAKAAEAPKPTTAAQTTSAVEKVAAARPATPNAAAANAARIRAAAGKAVGKAVNTAVNTARLVGGPNGPSSGSSFGAPSTAAAATSPATTGPSFEKLGRGSAPVQRVLPQTMQRGAEQDKVGMKRTQVAAAAKPAATTTQTAAAAPIPKAKPVTPVATKPAAPVQAVRKAAPQDSSTPAQRAQFNRQIDRGNAAPGTAYKGLGVTTGKTIQQKAAPQVKRPVGTGREK